MSHATPPPDSGSVPVEAAGAEAPAVRVFISYAHEDAGHMDDVWRLYVLLRNNGIDAVLDLPATDRRRDWSLWMLQQVRESNFVLIIASPEYRRRSEGDAEPGEGRGVQWEAALIRDEYYADRSAAESKFLPVLLPGRSTDDIPAWFGRVSVTSYPVTDFTVAGAEDLLRVITGQPRAIPVPLGRVPVLPSRLAWEESSRVAPFDRLFLHFFDPHFLDQVSRGRNKNLIAREARNATRLAVLAAHTVFVPAASYIESDLCAETVDEYRGLFDTGQITLVGGEANIVDFAARKLLQYEPDGPRYRRYEAVLSATAVTPPFRTRARSATSDITNAWQRRLDDLSVVVAGLPYPMSSLSKLEQRWQQVPDSLEGRAFTPEYVTRLLFDAAPSSGVESIVARRAGSEVNSAYFESYTDELGAGVVTELTYLNSPRVGGGSVRDLPYGRVMRALESNRVVDLVLGARPERLVELRSNPGVTAAVVSAVTKPQPVDHRTATEV
ncbi:SEFIR domain-containing protein [Actinophytocola sp. KF-1]